MKKKTPFLDIYYKAESLKDVMGCESGLCYHQHENIGNIANLGFKKLWSYLILYPRVVQRTSRYPMDFVRPTWEDFMTLRKKKKNDVYWGSDSKFSKRGKWTNLRRTLVLLMAAINGEFDK